jgi:hypothetical protein
VVTENSPLMSRVRCFVDEDRIERELTEQLKAGGGEEAEAGGGGGGGGSYSLELNIEGEATEHWDID